MKWLALLLLCVLSVAPAANAAVTVEEHILQKGLYINSSCKSDPSDPGYNECQCDADIRYPELSGLADKVMQATLNTDFKRAAEEARCNGKGATPETLAEAQKEKRSPSSVSHHYEITFQSPEILGLKLTDWTYTGGAHGNGSIDGVIVDLAKGKVLGPADIFAPKDLAAVNQLVYDTLSAKPEGEVFRDQIEERKGAFISDDGCQGCTLILAPTGLQVVFQTYEVASFAEGNMEVPVPVKYVSYPGIAHALAEQKPTTATEKK